MTLTHAGLRVFEARESVVRVYSRRFPVVFSRAKGFEMWDEEGRRYMDLLSGAGALNYGHNHPRLVEDVIAYLRSDGVVHSIDMYTSAKRTFLERMEEVVLAPRGMPHRVQFCGPTGTNAVEAALKLARRATGRTNVVAFTNGFHGMTTGALAATANAFKRENAHCTLPAVTRLPYDGYLAPAASSLEVARGMLTGAGSGVDPPAAVLVECVQGEGGANAASAEWLRGIAELTHDVGAVLVVDDVQAGCGRTGTFFSFDEIGISPDLVCLAKSISGMGLPLAAVLVHPELDTQPPGAHSGTFRGNNLALVAGASALQLWADRSFCANVLRRAEQLDQLVVRAAKGCGGQVRGRGLLRGLAWPAPDVAERASKLAFELGVLVETAGSRSEVLKILPPITVTEPELEEAFTVLEEAVVRAGRHQ